MLRKGCLAEWFPWAALENNPRTGNSVCLTVLPDKSYSIIEISILEETFKIIQPDHQPKLG